MSNFSEERVYGPQDRVRGAALVVGVGAVGGPFAEELAHLGLSPVVLVDPDIFQQENLARGNLSATALGQPKATGLAEQIRTSFPLCHAKGIDQDFLELSDELQRALVADADVVIAATDTLACQLRINRLCVQARKPAIYPGIWVDRGIRDAEVGEIIWVDPRTPTPCYQCASGWRREADEVRGWRGARTDIKMVVLVAAQVVVGLLQPQGERARMLDPERNCIWVHTYMPMSPGVAPVFEDIAGVRTVNLRVPWPRRRCPACGGREGQRRPPPPQPSPPPTGQPPPPEPPPQPPNTQLEPAQIRALIFAAVLAVICLVTVVLLVGKQRADVNNHGLQGNSSPYALFGFIIGVAAFAVIATLIQYGVVSLERPMNWRAVGISTLIFAVILGVIISLFAKHQSASAAASVPPPASSSSLSTTVKLKCDPNIGGSFCQAGGNGDNLALDILGVPNIYALCNSGYSLHFTDNHGQNLDDISGTGCLTITGGSDTSTLSDNGSGTPYVAFYPPTSSSTGNTSCGRWVIKLKIKDPSGAVVHAVRYSTVVRC